MSADASLPCRGSLPATGRHAPLTRRAFAAISLSAVCIAASWQAQAGTQPTETDLVAQARHALARLEASHGGRCGVLARDTASGRSIAYRADERFPLCSTHKFLTAAAVLSLVDRGQIALGRRVSYSRTELLDYAPVTRNHVDAGWMTVDALCAAAVTWSDNTAANLLLGLIGGPAGWTRYARSIGDTVSRLDRVEPALNSAIPGDPRDTTTPAAMARDLDAVLFGDALAAASRARLKAWMFASPVTGHLLHAGLPATWRVWDKSGSGEHGSRNDIGILAPPRAAPILASVYYTGSSQAASFRDQAVAEMGRIIATTLAGRKDQGA